MIDRVSHSHNAGRIVRASPSRGWLAAAALALMLTGGCDKSEEMRLRREATQLRGELSDAKQRAEDIKARMQRMRARNKVLIGLVEGLTAEPDKAAASEEAGVPSAHRALAALDRDIELLATTLRESREDMERLRSQRKALRTNLDEAMRTIEESKRREAQARERLQTYREMLLKLRSMIEDESLELQVVRNRMVVKLPEGLLFESGRARIKKGGRDALGNLAQVLAGIEDREFEIAGHTDDVPIRNWRYKSNWDLAAARAVNVTRFLVEQGVPRERLSAAAYADTRPVSMEETDEARAMNRRIEVVMLPKLDELPDLSLIDESATAEHPSDPAVEDDDGAAAAAAAEAADPRVDAGEPSEGATGAGPEPSAEGGEAAPAAGGSKGPAGPAAKPTPTEAETPPRAAQSDLPDQGEEAAPSSDAEPPAADPGPAQNPDAP